MVVFDINGNQNVIHAFKIDILFLHNPVELPEIVRALRLHLLKLRKEERIESKTRFVFCVDQMDVSIDALVIQPVAYVESHERLLLELVKLILNHNV